MLYVNRLFIEKLPKHPNYKNASKDDKLNTRKVIQYFIVINL